MRSRLLASLLPILIFPFLVSADDQPPVRLRKSELSHSPLFVGSLKITLMNLDGHGLFPLKGTIQVQTENTSTIFAIFFPQRLSFVNADNTQVDVLGVPFAEGTVSVADRRIAPGARIKEYYSLNSKVHLPARLYYDEKLLAVIAD